MSRQAARMQDPAGGVPPQLLPHMHLVSSYRYPVIGTLSTETAVEYLLSAPKVVREVQPMHWMFLDGPPDGTVMLVWQPLNHLGTNFASDGYVWADVEQIYTTEARGYNVEVWLHRCGYHPPNEPVATHCRRRYRLMPSKAANPNLPPADPSLWIVHYAKAPSIDQLPANRIPVVPQVQNILAQRRFLQSQGQLARKDFMLHDRNSWPTINLPPHVGHQPYAPGPSYTGQMGRQQAGGMYQQQQVGGTPSKQHRGPRPGPGSGVGTDFSLEEEDTTSGDLLDNITPRDISRMRYRNHHEWMEEIFASPYRISQIAPVDLGLGRKGELESATAGFFHTPSGPPSTQNNSGDSNAPAASGQLEPGKAEEFTDMVNRKVADMTAEMEDLKKEHARRMDKLKKSSVLRDGELKLRDALVDPSDAGPEFWRVEGHLQLHKEEGAPQPQYDGTIPKAKVDDIVRDVEESWEKPIVPITEVVCVDKGGLQERTQPVEPVKPTDAQDPGTADVNMGNHSGGPEVVQGQMTSQPSDPSTTQAAKSNEAPMAGGKDHPPPPTVSHTGAAEPNVPQNVQEAKPDTSEDVEMGGMQPEAVGLPGDQESGDWVIVNKDENAPVAAQPTDSSNQGGGAALDTTTAGSPGKGIQGLTPGATTDMGVEAGMLETSNFEDLAGFNSAGEALAAYGDQNDVLDLGGLDNSAFGDAFHASEGEEHVHHDTEEIP